MENKLDRPCWGVESMANKNLHFKRTNSIASNFISVVAYGGGEISTKDSAVYWSSLVSHKEQPRGV